MIKKYIIVEGPAGSGKTSVTSHLSEIEGVSVVRSSLNKRSFPDSVEPAFLSTINDWTKLTKAAFSKDSVVIIERLVISQMIYGSIRENLDSPIAYATGPLGVIDRLMETVHREKMWRLNQKIRDSYSYGFLFLIPDAVTLQEQRDKGGKEYPINPWVEIELYSRVRKFIGICGGNLLNTQCLDEHEALVRTIAEKPDMQMGDILKNA